MRGLRFMKEKFDSFCSALEKLKEALALEPVGITLDGSLQRFEFTYELAWKVLKIVLFKKGIECNSPRDCFEGAFQNGIIEDEQIWLSMIKDRNFSSHTYSEDQAKQIYDRVKKDYFPAFFALKSKLNAFI